jgi:hypothetical protein
MILKRSYADSKLRTGLRYLAFLFEHGEVFGYQFGVPEAAGGFFVHGLGGHFVREGGFVGAGGAEGVIDIDNLEDSGENWNLRSGQAVGIAGAVGMFVMMADDGQNQAQRTQRAADVFAGDGMEFHDHPFGGGEVAAFFQNLVGHGDFAEVVEIAAAFEGEDGIFVHAEVAAEIGGVDREAFAVAFGVGVAAFDDQAEGAEDGVGGFQFVGEFFQAEQRLHAGDEFFGQDGFVEEVVGAGFDAAHFVGAVAESGDEDEGNQARGRVIFQAAAEIVTGLAGHHDVGEDEVGELAANFGFGLFGVGGGDDVVSAHGQQLAHEASDAGLVVDDQNAGSATSW